eukprot:Hpha_TRINITY_DN14836_c0_g3::TRINITY_DN14836_c0_g3_i1::g.169897::m.169897
MSGASSSPSKKRQRSDATGRSPAKVRRPPNLDESSITDFYEAYTRLSQTVNTALSDFREYETSAQRDLCAGWSHLREQTENIEAIRRRVKVFVSASPEEDLPIVLDVGGQRFQTTRGTLCAVQDTLFTVLLAGQFSVEKGPEGAISIDREPELFKYVLNFLRDRREGLKSFSLKGLSQAEAARLACEAEFYGVDELKRLAMNCTARVVSLEVDAPFNSISAALEGASDGDRIVVYPGTYYETISTSKRVEVCGEGPREKIIIVTMDDSPTFSFVGKGGGVLRNLSLREMSPYGTRAVEVREHASLLIENCDLATRQNSNAIMVQDQASLTLRESRIHGVRGSAVYLRDNATATILSNLMVDLMSCGVFVRHNSRFYLQGNTIRRAALGGVDLNDNSTGTIDSNTIEECQRGGVVMYGKSHTLVKHNMVLHNEYGMRSFEAAQVVLKGNTVSDNKIANLQGAALRRADDEGFPPPFDGVDVPTPTSLLTS